MFEDLQIPLLKGKKNKDDNYGNYSLIRIFIDNVSKKEMQIGKETKKCSVFSSSSSLRLQIDRLWRLAGALWMEFKFYRAITHLQSGMRIKIKNWKNLGFFKIEKK